MTIIKILLISTLASIIPGQIFRFGAGAQGAITITDILVLLTGLVFLIHALAVKKSLKIPLKIFFPAVLFTFAAASSLYLSQTTFQIEEIIFSSFFLLRFFFYFLITIIVYNTVKKQQIQNWINCFLTIGFIYIIIGFIQFVVFSDLSSLTAHGWDPHQKRIVSTLLDPNFSGMIFAIVGAFATSIYLYQRKKTYLFLAIIAQIALILTFSRSSYLASIFTIISIGVLKSPKLIVASLILFLISFSALPQMRSRVIGAVTLDDTSQARIVSWNNAITIFLDNPIFGVGFNTYRYAQAKYGFFPTGELGGHSGAGTDSSILLVLTTTGIFGGVFYLLLLITIMRIMKKNAKSSFLKLASLASFMGLLVHSQFVNSLFFPQIMVILWFILGLNLVDDN